MFVCPPIQRRVNGNLRWLILACVLPVIPECTVNIPTFATLKTADVLTSVDGCRQIAPQVAVMAPEVMALAPGVMALAPPSPWRQVLVALPWVMSSEDATVPMEWLWGRI